MSSVGILGLGAALPNTIVTNEMLEKNLMTTDEWIQSRTGIRERRIASEIQSTGDLAIIAGQRALESFGSRDIQLVLLATTTPDFICPATAPYVSAKIGLGTIPAMDISAVCSGFIYALNLAMAIVKSNQAKNVLVIAAEKFSSLIDPNDKNTAVLFGDGAGAVVVGRIPKGTPGELYDSVLYADGNLSEVIQVKGGGSRYPLRFGSEPDFYSLNKFFAMEGKKVFSAAVTAMASSIKDIMEKVGWKSDDINWLISHQANKRILQSLCDIVGFPSDKAYIHLDKVGNTSAASIPLALAAGSALFKPGDKMILSAFGGGVTWGAVALSWPNIAVIDPH